MGKRSVKKDKNIYQLSREKCDLTREKASEALEFMSPDRIEKIESERSTPHPEEILAMSKAYHQPRLRNYFCSHECPIGQKYIPEANDCTLSEIVLKVLSMLQSLTAQRDRLIQITADGRIADDEYQDFVKIHSMLESIARTTDELRIWVDRAILEGIVDEETYLQYKEEPDQP